MVEVMGKAAESWEMEEGRGWGPLVAQSKEGFSGVGEDASPLV